MTSLSSSWAGLRACLAGAALCALSAAPAWAQAPANTASAEKAAPPAGFVAPAEPKADENTAQRAKSQPGNNAPFWRGVHDSGTEPGTTSLPGKELGILVQKFTAYPGSDYTNAGEAWRQVRNKIIIPYGGSLLFIVGLAIALFYWRVGKLGG
ncbi:MAG: formate dehydrogenase subunit gamma, partial [Betaproteobacteria bacterium]